LLLGLVAGLVGCDHATKHVAADSLRGQPPVVLVSGVLDLRYAENEDIGFSALRAVPGAIRRPLALTVSFVAIGLILLFWARRGRGPALERAGFGLVLAGAAGNLLDRVVHGYVVDFVHLHHWPIFNAADVYLTVGALLLVVVQARAVPARTGP
jgi:signal peptidase II